MTFPQSLRMARSFAWFESLTQLVAEWKPDLFAAIDSRGFFVYDTCDIGLSDGKSWFVVMVRIEDGIQKDANFREMFIDEESYALELA